MRKENKKNEGATDSSLAGSNLDFAALRSWRPCLSGEGPSTTASSAAATASAAAASAAAAPSASSAATGEDFCGAKMRKTRFKTCHKLLDLIPWVDS